MASGKGAGGGGSSGPVNAHCACRSRPIKYGQDPNPHPTRHHRMVASSPAAPRQRRTAKDMDRIRAAILDVLRQDQPMTVRQVFYRLVSAGAIAKTEAEYKTTVVRLLGEMRLDGQVPFGWIADNTRWM